MNWLRNNWPGLIVGIIILAIAAFSLSSFRGCGAATTAAGNGPSPIFFVIFSIVMILIGAHNRDQQYFGRPLLYFGILLLVTAVIGFANIKEFYLEYRPLIFFSLIAAAGVYGFNNSTGFLQKVIAGATGIIILILAWIVLEKFSGITSSSFSFPKISFPTDWFKNIGDFVFGPMSILVGTTVLFAFICYKAKGKVARVVSGTIALVLFFLVLGQSFFDFSASRWPKQVPTAGSIGQSIGNVGKSVRNLIPTPSSSQPSPSPASSTHTAPKAVKWVEYTRVDFSEPMFASLTTPIARLDEVPAGSYRFSHTVPTRIGKSGDVWTAVSSLNYDGAEPIFIKPLSFGNDKKIVIIYVMEK